LTEDVRILAERLDGMVLENAHWYREMAERMPNIGQVDAQGIVLARLSDEMTEMLEMQRYARLRLEALVLELRNSHQEKRDRVSGDISPDSGLTDDQTNRALLGRG
jgi:DICT domain-containing protein